MIILLLQFSQLLLSITMFFGFAFSISIIIFPKLLVKIAREKGIIYVLFITIAVGFTGNAILGYLLDILKALYWFYHFVLTIFFLIIVFWKRKIELRIVLDKFRFSLRNLMSRNYWTQNKTFKMIFLCSILLIIYFNIFNYPITHYSIPLTDPHYTMYIVRFILNNHYLYETAGGYHFYPYGMYYNLYFFSSYCPVNLFWIMKFFGPITISLSMIFMGLIIYNITKNSFASIVSILVWLSSPIISTFGVLTVASSFGIFLALNSFFLFFSSFKNTKNSKSYLRCSAFVLGGGFLYHSMVGGFFPIFGYIFYFLYEIIKKRKIYNAIIFLGILVSTLLPYIILFRLPEGLLARLLELSVSHENSVVFIPNLIASSSSGLIGVVSSYFNLNLYLGINLIIRWGPSSIFIFLSVLSIFLKKDYYKHIIFILGLTFISLFWIFNPIVINSIPFRNFLNENIYETLRGNYYFVIVISFFTGFAFESIHVRLKKFLNHRKKKYIQNGKKVLFSFLFFSLLINQLYMSLSIKTMYGSHWPNPIDDDYSECLNWLNIYAPEHSSVIIPPVDNWNFFDPIRISRYHEAMVYGAKFNDSSFFYKYLDNLEANNSFSNLWRNSLPGDSITDYSSYKGWFSNLDQSNFISEWYNKSHVLYLEKLDGSGEIFYNSFIHSFELDAYFPNSTLGQVYLIFEGLNYNNGIKFEIESTEVKVFAINNNIETYTDFNFSTNQWLNLSFTSLPELKLSINNTEIWRNKTAEFNIKKVVIRLIDYSFYIDELMITIESILKLQENVIIELQNTKFIILNEMQEFIELLDIGIYNTLTMKFTSTNRDFSIYKA